MVAKTETDKNSRSTSKEKTRYAVIMRKKGIDQQCGEGGEEANMNCPFSLFQDVLQNLKYMLAKGGLLELHFI